MIAAFRMFFATLASLFSATQKVAASMDHMASFVEGEALHFNNKATLVRIQDIKRVQAGYQDEDHAAALAEHNRQAELGKIQTQAKTK